MGKHRYEYKIVINKIPEFLTNPYLYTFKQTKNIAIYVNEKSALIEFYLTVKKDFDDLISFQLKLARDAIRKVYLLHALNYDEDLQITQIWVSIDGEQHSYTSEYPNFPFLFSMIRSSKLELGETWKKSRFQNMVLQFTKSEADKDCRFASLFSYLASLGKEFEIDRFTCLWTSMNAYYNFISTAYANTYRKVNQKENLTCRANSDRISLSIFMQTLGCGTEMSGWKDRNDLKTAYRTLGSRLGEMNEVEQKKFCDILFSNVALETIQAEPYSALETLNEISKTLNVTPFGIMLLEFPYYCRCNFLHGNRTTLLFSAYNDWEVTAFRVVNLILGRFLKENIPKIFEPDFFTDDMFNRVNPDTLRGK